MVVGLFTDSFTSGAARATCYITVPRNISKNTLPCLPKLLAEIALPVTLRKDTQRSSAGRAGEERWSGMLNTGASSV